MYICSVTEKKTAPMLREAAIQNIEINWNLKEKKTWAACLSHEPLPCQQIIVSFFISAFYSVRLKNKDGRNLYIE